MNSELTREQIYVIKSIADNKGGDLDTVILTAQEVQALADLALVGLSVQPRPIADCPVNDGNRYFLYSERGFERVDYWTSEWAKNHLNWHTPFTHFLPLSSLPTPKDVT